MSSTARATTVFLVFALFSLPCKLAHAQNGVELTRAKAFLAKRKPCAFWYRWSMEMYHPYREIGPTIRCAFDGVANPGTANETSGCMLGFYNLTTNEYQTNLVGNAAGPSEPGKRCTKAIIMKLLNTLMIPHSHWPSMLQDFLSHLAVSPGEWKTFKGRLEFGGQSKDAPSIAAEMQKRACADEAALAFYGDSLKCR